MLECAEEEDRDPNKLKIKTEAVGKHETSRNQIFDAGIGQQNEQNQNQMKDELGDRQRLGERFGAKNEQNRMNDEHPQGNKEIDIPNLIEIEDVEVIRLRSAADGEEGKQEQDEVDELNECPEQRQEEVGTIFRAEVRQVVDCFFHKNDPLVGFTTLFSVSSIFSKNKTILKNPFGFSHFANEWSKCGPFYDCRKMEMVHG